MIYTNKNNFHYGVKTEVLEKISAVRYKLSREIWILLWKNNNKTCLYWCVDLYEAHSISTCSERGHDRVYRSRHKNKEKTKTGMNRTKININKKPLKVNRVIVFCRSSLTRIVNYENDCQSCHIFSVWIKISSFYSTHTYSLKDNTKGKLYLNLVILNFLITYVFTITITMLSSVL